MFGWKAHHCFSREGLCVYCKSVFSFVLVFFLIFICLFNWLFFPFMLLFPTTPLFDPFPPSVLYLPLSPLFSHCLTAVSHSPLLFMFPTQPLIYISLPMSCCSPLFPNLSFCLSFCCPSSLPLSSSLHPTHRWSGGCHLGELALEVGAGQSLCPLTIWASTQYITIQYIH